MSSWDKAYICCWLYICELTFKIYINKLEIMTISNISIWLYNDYIFFLKNSTKTFLDWIKESSHLTYDKLDLWLLLIVLSPWFFSVELFSSFIVQLFIMIEQKLDFFVTNINKWLLIVKVFVVENLTPLGAIRSINH